jgi:CBS domain containing-hemolysin-like protein
MAIRHGAIEKKKATTKVRRGQNETQKEKIIPLKQGGWLVNATVSLDELEEVLPITFEAEDVLTLGGFLTEKLQHLPKKGERLLYKKYYFQIQKASMKRVLQVLIFEDKNNHLLSSE